MRRGERKAIRNAVKKLGNHHGWQYLSAQLGVPKEKLFEVAIDEAEARVFYAIRQHLDRLGPNLELDWRARRDRERGPELIGVVVERMLEEVDRARRIKRPSVGALGAALTTCTMPVHGLPSAVREGGGDSPFARSWRDSMGFSSSPRVAAR